MFKTCGLASLYLFWFLRNSVHRFRGKASIPCMYMYITNFLRKSRFLRRYCGKTFKDRDFYFCTSASSIYKAKTAKFQVPDPSGSWFSRQPIFNFPGIVYNSAGKFSTTLKTFPSESVFRTFLEQGASLPVLRSRRASPSSSRGLRPREEEE